jgi:NtrC-family two-component system sensor histidine kinase KinB
MLIKTKLSLGLGFLFIIIFILAGFCSYYVGKSAQDADNILKDNYVSIVYSRNMLSALDDMNNSLSSNIFNPVDTGTISDYYQQLFESGKKKFDTNLKDENNNITEINEKEYVENLNHDYEIYLKLNIQMKKNTNSRTLYFNDFLPASEKLKQSINRINDINMQAVVRKSQLVKKDASDLNATMAVIATVCLLLAFVYFWYFPFYISSTYSYLADRIKVLLNNLDISFDIKTNDEAFVILQSINLLENKLDVKNADKKIHNNASIG